jgi:hypothetical protein
VADFSAAFPLNFCLMRLRRHLELSLQHIVAGVLIRERHVDSESSFWSRPKGLSPTCIY